MPFDVNRPTRRGQNSALARPAEQDLWMPNWSSTLCELGIFVYRSAEPVATSEAEDSGAGWGSVYLAGLVGLLMMRQPDGRQRRAR